MSGSIAYGKKILLSQIFRGVGIVNLRTVFITNRILM